MLLVEQVDRLSRLTAPDWLKLRAEIDAKQVRIVALDLPTLKTAAGAQVMTRAGAFVLESSTVDLATELTTMIATQRSYEANSKVLTTGVGMLSTLIQDIR